MKVYHLPRLRCALLGLLPLSQTEDRRRREQSRLPRSSTSSSVVRVVRRPLP